MSIVNKHNITDKSLSGAIRELEDLATKGTEGNFGMKNGITNDHLNSMKEGVRYVDNKNKRTVYRIGNKLFYQSLTEL